MRILCARFSSLSLHLADFHKLPLKTHLQENIGLVIPWMVGILTFMSLEAVSTVYLNILRDHINGVRKYFTISAPAMFALFEKFLLTSFSILMACAKQKLWVHKFILFFILMKSEVEIPIGANGLRPHHFISRLMKIYFCSFPLGKAVLPRSCVFQCKFYISVTFTSLKRWFSRQTVAMYVVMRFYHMVRSGISFKVNETFIELWQNSSFGSDDKSSTTISFCPDDIDDGFGYCHRPNSHVVDDIFEYNEDISEGNNVGIKKAADDGSDENDSLLVAYDENSVDSVWQKRSQSTAKLTFSCKQAIGLRNEFIFNKNG